MSQIIALKIVPYDDFPDEGFRTQPLDVQFHSFQPLPVQQYCRYGCTTLVIVMFQRMLGVGSRRDGRVSTRMD